MVLEIADASRMRDKIEATVVAMIRIRFRLNMGEMGREDGSDCEGGGSTSGSLGLIDWYEEEDMVYLINLVLLYMLCSKSALVL